MKLNTMSFRSEYMAVVPWIPRCLQKFDTHTQAHPGFREPALGRSLDEVFGAMFPEFMLKEFSSSTVPRVVSDSIVSLQLWQIVSVSNFQVCMTTAGCNCFSDFGEFMQK